MVGKKGLEENDLFVLPESILMISYINYATVLRKCSIVLPNPRLVFFFKEILVVMHRELVWLRNGD